MKRKEGGPKIGLVLSGGAGKSFFQVGALCALLEVGVRPHFVVAVSAGALAAAKYVECYDARELELMVSLKFKKPPFYKNTRSLICHPFRTKSLLCNAPLRKIIDEIKIDRIFQSPIELQIATTDILKREEHFFSNRDQNTDVFKRAILASTALPGFFEAVEINGEMHIDGGMFNPLPIKRAVQAGCDMIIVIDSDATEDHISLRQFMKMGWTECQSRGYHIPIKALSDIEIDRTLRINKRIRAFESLRHKLVDKFGPNCEDNINQMFEDALQYFHYDQNNREIQIVSVCPKQNILKSHFKWTSEEVAEMIADGKRAAKRELKRVGLI